MKLLDVQTAATTLATQQMEQAILGSILSNPQKIMPMVEEILEPTHFSDPLLGAIYQDFLRVWNAGGTPEMFAVKRLIEKRPEMEGTTHEQLSKFVADLYNATVGINEINISYAQAIRDAWHRRAILSTLLDISHLCQQPGEMSSQAISEQLEEELLQIAQKNGDTSPNVSVWDAVCKAHESAQAAAQRGDALEGISSGYHGFDELTGGLTGGNLYLIGARPGMGKTALGLGIAARAASAGNRVLFWSGEMPDRQLGARMASAYTGIDLRTVRMGRSNNAELSQKQWGQFQDVCDHALALPMEIDSREGLTVSQLRSRARRMKRSRQGLDLIVLDYVGLMKASAATQRRGLYEAMTEISKGLKALAKELDVPVVALAQLSRKVEERPDKKPIMSDLRDSGGLEQDADVIGLLYRAVYYLQKERSEGQDPHEKEEDWDTRKYELDMKIQREEERADLFVVKNRHGREGTVELRFNAPTTWFWDASDTRNTKAWGERA